MSERHDPSSGSQQDQTAPPRDERTDDEVRAQFKAMSEPDPADYAEQPDTGWAEPESNLSIDLSDTKKARAYAAAASACKTATVRTRYRRAASQHRHRAARRLRGSRPLESRLRR